MADSNALYSTVVQSSAIIVAIVGAIVTSDIVKLDSQKELLEREIRSAEQDRDASRRSADEMMISLIERTRLSEIAAWKSLPGGYHAAQQKLGFDSSLNFSASDISQESFSAWWTKLNWDISEVDILLRRARSADSTFPEWIRGLGVELTDRQEWLIQQRYKLTEDTTARTAAKLPVQDKFHSSLTSESIQELLMAINLKQILIKDIERRLDLLQDRRIEIGDPAMGLRKGLLVWICISLLGVGPSLWLMPQDEADFRTWHKVAVLSCFFGGLLIGAWYLWAKTRVISVRN